MNPIEVNQRVYALIALAQALNSGQITQKQYNEIRAIAK